MSGLPTVTILLWGHEYTAEYDGKTITRVGCKGRWPLYDVRFTGLYEPILAELQRQIDAIVEAS